jgi:hypothetical protein
MNNLADLHSLLQVIAEIIGTIAGILTIVEWFMKDRKNDD